ncbi:hypothetical protein L6260_04035, partial [Candidatus Parcubacteria bacterium]|nr:hypothetical protein [Candidatus Parcubacteria bacterium]
MKQIILTAIVAAVFFMPFNVSAGWLNNSTWEIPWLFDNQTDEMLEYIEDNFKQDPNDLVIINEKIPIKAKLFNATLVDTGDILVYLKARGYAPSICSKDVCVVPQETDYKNIFYSYYAEKNPNAELVVGVDSISVTTKYVNIVEKTATLISLINVQYTKKVKRCVKICPADYCYSYCWYEKRPKTWSGWLSDGISKPEKYSYSDGCDVTEIATNTTRIFKSDLFNSSLYPFGFRMEAVNYELNATYREMLQKSYGYRTNDRWEEINASLEVNYYTEYYNIKQNGDSLYYGEVLKRDEPLIIAENLSYRMNLTGNDTVFTVYAGNTTAKSFYATGPFGLNKLNHSISTYLYDSSAKTDIAIVAMIVTISMLWPLKKMLF